MRSTAVFFFFVCVLKKKWKKQAHLFCMTSLPLIRFAVRDCRELKTAYSALSLEPTDREITIKTPNAQQPKTKQ